MPEQLLDRSAKELCEIERDQALSDVEQLVGEKYQAVKVVTRDVLSSSEGHFIGMAEMVLIADNTPVRSFALVSVHEGLFLKVRASDVGTKRERIMADVLEASNAFFAAARATPLEALRHVDGEP